MHRSPDKSHLRHQVCWVLLKPKTGKACKPAPWKRPWDLGSWYPGGRVYNVTVATTALVWVPHYQALLDSGVLSENFRDPCPDSYTQLSHNAPPPLAAWLRPGAASAGAMKAWHLRAAHECTLKALHPPLPQALLLVCQRRALLPHRPGGQWPVGRDHLFRPCGAR